MMSERLLTEQKLLKGTYITEKSVCTEMIYHYNCNPVVLCTAFRQLSRLKNLI